MSALLLQQGLQEYDLMFWRMCRSNCKKVPTGRW